MVIKMNGIIAAISMGIGITIYRNYFGVNPGIIDSAIVGAITGGIGGALSMLYQHYFGKHHISIVNIVDNILWFCLFCIPGAILGSIISTLFISGNNGSGQTWTIIIAMVAVSIPLTIRKMKKKEKILKKDFFEDLH